MTGQRLTVFAAPRPFTGEFERIQMNAIHSWTCLDPAPQVLVFASDETAPDACRTLGASLVQGLPAMPSGAPMLDALFAQAQDLASGDLLVYVNPDVILLQDFVVALERARARFGAYVAIAAPWNVQVDLRLEGSPQSWSQQLIDVKLSGTPPDRRSGADVFAFPPGGFDPVPRVGIGRLGWDNWLLWRAATGPLPSLDLSDAATVIHQDHAGTTHRGSLTATEDLFSQDVRANLGQLRWPERIARRSEIGWQMTNQGILRKQPFGPRGARVRVAIRHARLAVTPALDRLGLIRPLKAMQQRWQDSQR